MIDFDILRVKIYNTEMSSMSWSNPSKMLNLRRTEYTMIKFKECPRCQGDLYITEDGFGRYLSCLQCGYLRDLAQPVPDSQMESRLDSAPAAATLQEAELEAA